MGDQLPTIILAIATLIGAIGTAAAGVITALRASPRERDRAARGALEKLREATQDGDLTADEVAAILDAEGGEDQ